MCESKQALFFVHTNQKHTMMSEHEAEKQALFEHMIERYPIKDPVIFNDYFDKWWEEQILLVQQQQQEAKSECPTDPSSSTPPDPAAPATGSGPGFTQPPSPSDPPAAE
jgi:hypothetical protein